MILCAAVKVHFNKLDKDLIIPCIRHGNVRRDLRQIGLVESEDFSYVEEGFLDNRENFFNRTEALIKAKEVGQLPMAVLWDKQDGSVDELFSEDLY